MKRLLILFPLLVLAMPSMAGYQYYRTMTVNNGQVNNGQGTYTNFPVLVQDSDVTLSTQSSGGHLQNSSGFDVVFSTFQDCHYLLFWDTETINNTGSATFTAWVNVPSISSTTNTVFYMCYGNSGVTSYQGNATNAWDANYDFVYHMNDNAGNTNIKDSTSNSRTGTATQNTSAMTGSGEINSAISFNGTSDDITFSATTSTNAQTVSLWAYPTANAYSIIVGNASGAYITYFNGGISSIQFDNCVLTTGLSTLNAWHKLDMVRSAGNLQLYVDGTTQGSCSSEGTTAGSWSTISLYAGNWYHGKYDEFRVSNIARSGPWLSTDYNNQSSPSTFITIGNETQEVQPGSLIIKPPMSLQIMGGQLIIL